MENFKQYLDPKVLNKISNLELKARLIVEGYISGMHKSPYKGFSVEFAQHREYVPGDDIRYIDWKVYGRSDRYYIKQYEEETNLISYFLLDSSNSMHYKSKDVSKYDYGSYIASSLAYLILQQQDAVSLSLFNNEVKSYLPPSSNPAYIKDIIFSISSALPENKTSIKDAFREISKRIKKSGLIIIISDLFDDIANVVSGLRDFRYQKHDIIVFHVLDPDEINFPLQKLTLFEGIENIDLKLLANPRALRKSYLEEFNSFIKKIKSCCVAHKIDYFQIATNQSLGLALSAYLATRASKIRR